MTWSNKVTWSEGLFLRPQLFQQQERYLELQIHNRTKPLTPFYWGFSNLQVDHESLYFGKLVLSRASGIFVDGTAFDVPNQAVPPPPLTILPEHINKLIYLALPIRTPNGEETTFDNANESLARNTVFQAEVRDSNSIGQGAKPIQLSQLRLRLVPETELSSAWMGLPIARVLAINSDNSIILDDNFIAPVNIYGASEMLSQWAMQLNGNLLQRTQMLAQRLSSTGGLDHSNSIEVSDFLVLQTLNRYVPQFERFLQIKELSPEHLYALLKVFSSELSTFLRTDTRRQKNLPAYQHIDPYASFKALVDDVRELLNNVMVRSAETIYLEQKEHGLRQASIDPNQLASFTKLIIAVSASQSLEQIANQFPKLSKIGPTAKISELVRFHLPGISISLLPGAPRQIPFSSGFVYFQIEQVGSLWDLVSDTGGLAIHLASELPNVKLELWGIK